MEYLIFAFGMFLFILGFSIIISILRGIIPPMPSSPKVVAEIIKIIKKENTSNEPIVEIGCGYGFTLFRLAHSFPDRQIIGYEISLLPYLVVNLIKRLAKAKNVKIIYGNAFKLIEKENVKMSCCVAYLYDGKKINEDMEKVYLNNVTDIMVLNSYPLKNFNPSYISENIDVFKSKIYAYKK